MVNFRLKLRKERYIRERIRHIIIVYLFFISHGWDLGRVLLISPFRMGVVV